MKQFHPFRLDTVNHCLWRGEQRVPLTPKAFDLLRYLVEHADRLVTQNELLEALWAGTYVNQEVIKKYILEIRKVLGDRAAQPAFIETAPRRGYRFVAPVQDIRGAAASGSNARTSSVMVGRGSAQTRLERALDRAFTGVRQVVFVTGEVGVGKTTLVDAFQEHASARPRTRIARGHCVEGFGGKEAYYPALEAFGQMLRGRGGAAVAQVLAARAPTWLAQFPSFVAPEQREGLQRDIVGSTRDRMVRELCEGVEALATETPLVFILEDLHWVDLATLDVLSALARRRGPVRLVVVATYRPDDVSASNPLKGLKQDLLVHQLCDEIALDPLAEADVAEYLAAEFPGAAVPGLASLIHRHSGGSPLFMVGIVQDMVKKAQLAWDHDRGWTLAACVEDISPAVPDSLQQMLEVQFGQLSSAEQRILEHASVMGERFSVWAITTPADLSAEHIENACEGLAERRQFIRSTGLRELTDRSISAHYEFRHSLFRQAVYESLSGVHRARLHRTVGERLAALCTPEHPEAAGEVAGHFEAAREYGRAIDYLVQSADNAVRRFAYRESIQTLGRALALVPRMSSGIAAGVEVQLRERIGDAHYWFGAMAASAREYEAAATLAANAGLASARARLLSGLVRPLGLIDPDRGIAAVEAAERLSATLPGALQHEHVRFLAAGSRLMYDTWRHDDWEICASAREAIQRLSVAGLPAYHRVIYGHLQVLQGHYAEALEHLDVGIPSSEEPTSLMAYFFAHSGRTLALLHSGQFGELLHIIRAETDKAEKNGSDPWLFSFREAWLRTAVLDFDGARQLCDRLTGVSPEAPLGQPRTIARFSAGCTALALRRYDVARRQFEEILDPQITPKFFLHWHWRMKARLGLSNAWLAAGELERAGEEANQFSESVASTAEPNLQTLACEVQARVAMAARDLTGAADHIQRAVAIVESFDIPTYAWRVHATCAELYRRLKDEKSADRHRKRAEAVIGSLAGSFALNEPLRRSFLAAPEIERIRHASMPRTGARGRGSSHSAHHASD